MSREDQEGAVSRSPEIGPHLFTICGAHRAAAAAGAGDDADTW